MLKNIFGKRPNKVFCINRCKPYIFSTLSGCTVFFGGVGIISLIMLKYFINEPVLYYLAYVFLLTGGFFCGKSLFKRIGGRGFLSGIKGSIPYALIVFTIICLLAPEKSSSVIFIIPICVLGGFLGGIAAVNKK